MAMQFTKEYFYQLVWNLKYVSNSRLRSRDFELKNLSSKNSSLLSQMKATAGSVAGNCSATSF